MSAEDVDADLPRRGGSRSLRGGAYSDGTMQFRPATSLDVPLILDMMEDFNRLEHIPWQRGPGEAPLRTLIGSRVMCPTHSVCVPLQWGVSE